jgi:hypothetical protein
MLKPTKHSHPDQTVIFVAMHLLTRLKTQRLESYDKLLRYAKKAVRGGDVLFLSALNFLYLLGLIEYRPKNDMIEYLGPNEAI